MRAAIVIALALVVSCTSKKPASNGESTSVLPSASGAASPGRVTVQTRGPATALRIEGDAVLYCDASGAQTLNLQTGKSVPAATSCSNQEPNTSCTGFALDVTVNAPLDQPNDVVDVAGAKFPMTGRVHDCAANGKSVAVATNSSVVVIDSAAGATSAASTVGGERVAISERWVAWSQDSTVTAAVRTSLPRTKPDSE